MALRSKGRETQSSTRRPPKEPPKIRRPPNEPPKTRNPDAGGLLARAPGLPAHGPLEAGRAQPARGIEERPALREVGEVLLGHLDARREVLRRRRMKTGGAGTCIDAAQRKCGHPASVRIVGTRMEFRLGANCLNFRTWPA